MLQNLKQLFTIVSWGISFQLTRMKSSVASWTWLLAILIQCAFSTLFLYEGNATKESKCGDLLPVNQVQMWRPVEKNWRKYKSKWVTDITNSTNISYITTLLLWILIHKAHYYRNSHGIIVVTVYKWVVSMVRMSNYFMVLYYSVLQENNWIINFV